MEVVPIETYTMPSSPADCAKASRSAGSGLGSVAVSGPVTCPGRREIPAGLISMLPNDPKMPAIDAGARQIQPL